jgi:hypothetical protein
MTPSGYSQGTPASEGAAYIMPFLREKPELD